MCMSSSCSVSIEDTYSLEDQQIGMTTVYNARQLGDYKIGARRIKRNLLLRGGNLASLSDNDAIIFADQFRLQKIYDFRGAEEMKMSPDIIPGNAQYMPLSVSMTSGGSSDAIGSGSQKEILSYLMDKAEDPRIIALCNSIYDKILLDKDSQDVYRRFFADLVTLDPEKGAVYWHCTQGKDRAGCASALLLAALGADRQLIMHDYILSKKFYDPLLSKIPYKSDAQYRVIYTLLSANPEVFEATLDKIDLHYGSLRTYMTECLVVTPEMMEILQDNYLE